MTLSIFRMAICLALLATVAVLIQAERLPLKTYTIADGLARDNVARIVRDLRGFLWFCTNEGLSRFDGYRFTNYGINQGLPGRIVNDFIETRGGVYWVATNNGLCRFDPDAASAQQRFVMDYQGEKTVGQEINSVLEDQNGIIWCGGMNAFFRLERVGDRWVCSKVSQWIKQKIAGTFSIGTMVSDRHGALWMILNDRLFRKLPNGELESFAAAEGVPVPVITLLKDSDERIWLGAPTGLYQLVSDPHPHSNAVANVYNTHDGLTHNNINSLFQAADGRFWIGANGDGLNVSLPVDPEANGTKPRLRFRGYTKANGLSSVGRMAQDRDGNLWIGTESSGAMRLTANGFTTYDENDGLLGLRVASLIYTRDGEFCSLGSHNGRLTINRFNGQRFETSQIGLPAGITYWGWGWYQTMFQSRAGEWWMQTGQGIVRFPNGKRIDRLGATHPQAIYTNRDGLSDGEPFRIFEDTKGDVWIGTFSSDGHSLTRWERKTETFHTLSLNISLPPQSAPTAFAEDAAGNLWIGFYTGELVRYANGRLTGFNFTNGVPGGIIRGIFLDHAHRLWVATGEAGAVRIENPDGEQPHFSIYNTTNGLSSNQVSCFTEDQWGRLYIGTGRGVDQLDTDGGLIRHYTTADGLANSFVSVALRDHNGALWFGTLQGLSRLIPQADSPAQSPPILISELRIGGVLQRISALGVINIPTLTLEPNQNQVRINFFGLSYGAGEVLRYQYKLEGADKDWSTPVNQRVVDYANLAPGAYRFLVRAVTSNGTVSQTPATVSFKVLPSVWRRWWFLALVLVITFGALLAFERYRSARLQALRESESRFRTLAATASDAIVTIDTSGTIVFANPAVEQIFGHTIIAMIGKDLTMLMPEYLRQLHQQGFARYQQTGQRHLSWRAIELPGLHHDGHEIPLELSFGEFEQQGQRYFTGIVRDITERKRAAEALQQARDERLRELERVRRRIATDLHDDIGSSLTQISILSEVLRQRLNPATGAPTGDGQPQINEPLQLIANASRELVDSMSDIVWAINPQKDHLRDLTQRLRRFAADSFTARNIKFQLRLPESLETAEDVQLGANLRREVFLIFKEGVNNMIKHSGCTEADIELNIVDGMLNLRLQDNGQGFDLTSESDGHGLASMLDRAKGIGGQFQITSKPGNGTTITLSVELEERLLTGRRHNQTT